MAQRLSRLTGWRRLAMAFVVGAVTLFAFAPYSIVPVLWLTFPALLWMLDGCRTWRAAAATGWAFGFGHFLTSFYWISEAFFVDAETFGLIAWPAVTGLAAGVGLFIAIVAAVTHFIPPAGEDEMPDDRVAVTALRIVLFAATWTVVEWVRSWIFTGFAWNPLGAVWSETRTPVGLAVVQVTTLIGTYGLTLVTAVFAAMPAVLGHLPRFRRVWLTAAAPVVLLLLIGAGGAARLATADVRMVPGVKLRLVQAGISQRDRARPSLWESQLADYVSLSTSDRPADITHVIWGEAAVPPTFFLNLDERRRGIAAGAAPPGGHLITGADRGLRDETRWIAIYNSLYALTPAGEIAATYDKAHLVPFGEYMPMRWLIPYDKIAGGLGDFSAGDGLVTLTLPGLPAFTPLICYEAIFSGDVTPGGLLSESVRPRWLLNLTNDAWFGMSTGPYQHYATARLRAVEEGLSLVRVANTGISAVIDGYGRTVAELGLGERGVLDTPLPEAASEITLFGLLGNVIPLILATAAGVIALTLYRRRIHRMGPMEPME
jgi:apolipoprotein N-acyltransferase